MIVARSAARRSGAMPDQFFDRCMIGSKTAGVRPMSNQSSCKYLNVLFGLELCLLLCQGFFCKCTNVIFWFDTVPFVVSQVLFASLSYCVL